MKNRMLIVAGLIVVLGYAMGGSCSGQEPKEKQAAPAQQNLPAQEMAPVAAPVAVDEITQDDHHSMLRAVRVLLIAEINVLHKACNLSSEQRTKIERELATVALSIIEKVEKVAAKNHAEQQNNGQPVENPADAESFDMYKFSQKMIDENLFKTAKKVLSADALRRYQQELEKRKQYEKQTSLQVILDAIDRELFLSPAQQTSLERELTSHWNDDWWPSASSLLETSNPIPNIPPKVIERILTPAQMEIWRRLEKNAAEMDLTWLEVAEFMADLPLGRAEDNAPPEKPQAIGDLPK